MEDEILNTGIAEEALEDETVYETAEAVVEPVFDATEGRPEVTE